MKKTLGGALQGCGILIAGLSGLCALGVLIGSIVNLDLSLLLVTLVRQARWEEERDRLPPA
jgi:hypothetical protein